MVAVRAPIVDPVEEGRHNRRRQADPDDHEKQYGADEFEGSHPVLLIAWVKAVRNRSRLHRVRSRASSTGCAPNNASLTPISLEIGIAAVGAADLATLMAIQRGHRLAIAFENLDIPLGREIDLSPAAIFRKLVTQRRGGYCFEQNALLLWALKASDSKRGRCSRASG